MGDRGNVILRKADRYFGIPLIFVLGLFVRKKKCPSNFSCAAVLATAAIGDTLLISAVLKDFIKAFPDVPLTIYCGQSNEGTFRMVFSKMMTELDSAELNLIVIPVKNPLKSIQMIRKDKFDVWVDFGPWPRINSLLTFFAKSRFKTGFKSIKQHRHFIYNQVIEHQNSCHELDNLRRLMTPFGLHSQSTPFLGESTPDKDNPYIVVHMFPSGYKAHYKEWSDKNWTLLLDGLTQKGWNIKLTGAPKDVEASLRIVKGCANSQLIEVLAGKTNLIEVGDIIQRSQLVISVNTGIMHMAAAYNQRVVALHGSTSVLRWGPVCDNPVNFAATSLYAGCLHLGFEYNKRDNHSLDTIVPGDVLIKVFSMLDSK